MQMKFIDRIKLLIDKFIWHKLSILHILLLPFAYIFQGAVTVRRWLYMNDIIAQIKFPVPIIIVGNITVGGNGKTPFVQWLVIYLLKKGYRPGIVSRGYGGASNSYPLLLNDKSETKVVGEEAKLLQQLTNCPVVVDPNRPRAVKFLLNNRDCNIIVSDDGLQHYAMGREIEIVLIDSKRNLGNGYCLPAGPLREPLSRIKNNMVVYTNKPELDEDILCMSIKPKKLINILNDDQINLSSLRGKKVVLITSIANPTRIKDIIDRHTKNVEHLIFPDHYQFEKKDFTYFKDKLLVMTLKDAVKCKELVGENSWYIDYKVTVSKKLQNTILEHLKVKKHK